MAPGPGVEQMIATVRADTAHGSDLEQLMTASRAVAELEEVADATLAHFVEQCRSHGRSWSEISKALGVTKQAAHKRFSFATAALARFTPRARASLETAADAARSFGHSSVGTEHVLLGLFAPSESVAARVLAQAGLTRARTEQRILAESPRGPFSEDAELPPTPRVAECLERAVAEARQLGHNYVGTEHLLLALFGDTQSVAASILTDAAATYDDFRERVVGTLMANRRPQR